MMEVCFVQCKTSLADSPELRVKSAGRTAGSADLPSCSLGSQICRMWSCELALPARPSSNLGGVNQQPPASESRSQGTDLRTNTTQRLSAAKLASGRMEQEGS